LKISDCGIITHLRDRKEEPRGETKRCANEGDLLMKVTEHFLAQQMDEDMTSNNTMEDPSVVLEGFTRQENGTRKEKKIPGTPPLEMRCADFV
jgi:hypothetical protein